jgi:phosphotriesterase-related protein
MIANGIGTDGGPAVSNRMSRREALGRVATGLGIASVLNVERNPVSAAQRATAAATRRTTVQTVLGPVDSSKLGFTLSHEHINASSAGIWQAWPALLGGRATFIANAVDQLKRAKDEGVNSIIDCTTIDLGRDIRLMEEISRKSGMQVIASTGHWLDPSNTMRARTIEELTDFFVREATVGIEGTDVKAGIIKVANGGMIDAFGEKLLRAASRASKATGLPMTTHSPGAQRVGEKQAAIFEEEGVSPSKVCIGHTDNSPADYQAGLARRGYYLGMDQLPRGGPAPPGTPLQAPGALTWEQRYAQIKALVDAGFTNRLMLGNDHSLGMTLQTTASDPLRVAQNPDGMLFVVRRAIPALRKIGISDQAIRTMTVEVPRRFLEVGA